MVSFSPALSPLVALIKVLYNLKWSVDKETADIDPVIRDVPV
jgi:hypothetical protein